MDDLERTPTEDHQPPVEIPIEMLSADALTGIMDDFILREGTDYGTQEISLDSKRERVLKQLKSGKIKLVFDPNIESINLLTADEFRKLQIP